MKKKASVAHDFMKVSRDLEEALARGPFTACELRVISWIKARTYGVRVRDGQRWAALDAIAVSSSFVSSDTGLNRGRVKEAIESLLGDQVLRRKANGWLGINSRLDAWKRDPQGRDFDFNAKPRTDIGRRAWDKVSLGQGVTGGGGQGVPGNGGQGVTGDLGQGVPGAEMPSKERARVEIVERENGRGKTPPVLPNGRTDTPKARAELGHPDYPPHDHPSYTRLAFPVQTSLAEEWRQRKTGPTAGAGKKCVACGWRDAVKGARVCEECAWCVPCDRAGRQSERRPHDLLVKDGHGICRDCAAGGNT